jgi:hypothetical protein
MEPDPACSSYELDPPGGEQRHPRQQPAVPPAPDIRRPVGAFAVADRQLDDLQSEALSAEEQVEVAERVKVAKIANVRLRRPDGDLVRIVFNDDDALHACSFAKRRASPAVEQRRHVEQHGLSTLAHSLVSEC